MKYNGVKLLKIPRRSISSSLLLASVIYCVAFATERVPSPSEPSFPGVGDERTFAEACKINEPFDKVDPNESVRLCEKAIARYPFYWGFFFNLGLAELHLKSLTEAECAFKNALEVARLYPIGKTTADAKGKKIGRISFWLARVLNAESKVDEADNYYKAAAEIDGSYWDEYSQFCKKCGREEDAQKAIQQSQKYKSEHFAPADMHMGESF